MKVYLAGQYETRFHLQCLKNTIFKEDKVTSRWLERENVNPYVALFDMEDIDNADVLIAFNPFGKGTTAEIAYALGKGKPIFFCIDEANLSDFKTSKFYWPLGLANIMHVDIMHEHGDLENLITSYERLVEVVASLRETYK